MLICFFSIVYHPLLVRLFQNILTICRETNTDISIFLKNKVLNTVFLKKQAESQPFFPLINKMLTVYSSISHFYNNFQIKK